MKQNIKPYLLGLLTGVILVSAGFGFWYFTQPKQALAQKSEMQVWVDQHPKQVEWAKNRYDRFQKAAEDAYMQDDVADIKSSK